jgi:hypothetical protein
LTELLEIRTISLSHTTLALRLCRCFTIQPFSSIEARLNALRAEFASKLQAKHLDHHFCQFSA